jgi:hypothetical protein
MIGKKNIVFGFLFLVLTAALGPYMIKTQIPQESEAQAHKQTTVARLQLLASSDFEDPQTLDKLTSEQIARENTAAILAINQQLNAGAPVDAIKGGPHAHGNLEALLNIVAGLVLCFIAIKPAFKQIISWVFIAGALLHSGILYLVVVFQQEWAAKVLGTGIGPVLVLLGLLLIGIAAAIGFRGEVVKD